MPKRRNFYRYSAGVVRKDGTFVVCISSNSLYPIESQAREANYELREHLPDIRIGKKKFENRFRVLRRQTSQISITDSRGVPL